MRRYWIDNLRWVTVLLVLVTMQLQAQDLAHYKHIVKELSSAKYQGRGYAKNGANKAGRFLQKEYVKAGVDEVVFDSYEPVFRLVTSFIEKY